MNWTDSEGQELVWLERGKACGGEDVREDMSTPSTGSPMAKL